MLTRTCRMDPTWREEEEGMGWGGHTSASLDPRKTRLQREFRILLSRKAVLFYDSHHPSCQLVHFIIYADKTTLTLSLSLSLSIYILISYWFFFPAPPSKKVMNDKVCNNSSLPLADIVFFELSIKVLKHVNSGEVSTRLEEMFRSLLQSM